MSAVATFDDDSVLRFCLTYLAEADEVSYNCGMVQEAEKQNGRER